jgi:hypothetical protein
MKKIHITLGIVAMALVGALAVYAADGQYVLLSYSINYTGGCKGTGSGTNYNCGGPCEITETDNFGCTNGGTSPCTPYSITYNAGDGNCAGVLNTNTQKMMCNCN